MKASVSKLDPASICAKYQLRTPDSSESGQFLHVDSMIVA